MKQQASILTAILAAFLLLGCKEKKTTNVIIAPKPVVEKPQGPQRMGETNQRETVKWLGKNYTVEVKRAAADSLPKVKDESGKVYYDNLIRVKVLREDGSEFFNRVFSKKSFDGYLDENTRKSGALLGIVLVGEDPEQLAKAFKDMLAGNWKASSVPDRWDGRTAERILQILIENNR